MWGPSAKDACCQLSVEGAAVAAESTPRTTPWCQAAYDYQRGAGALWASGKD